MRLVGGVTAAVLLLRGVALEVLLLADPAYGHGAISRAERHWSLVLWNPWFVVGGVLFAVSAAGARPHPAGGAHRRPNAR